MTFTQKANNVVEQAKQIAPTVGTWADFNNAVFNQREGLIATAFADDTERQLFYDSDQYKALSQMRLQLMKKFGAVAGGTPEKSGRFLVRIPKTMHKSLEVEAAREGVSLNQLALTKLSLPLSERVNVSVQTIADAYAKVYDGWSVDRIVVDPELNVKFLGECRRRGLAESAYHLNHALMDIRKSGKAELPKATKKTEFKDYDQFQFASEIAVRLLQRSNGVSLDQILCDPELGMEFDRIAGQLAPKQPVLKLRWAALNLRKTRRLRPMDPADKEAVHLITAGPVKLIQPSDIPDSPGVYSFFDVNRPLYAGETGNLQQRIGLHRDGRLPTWLGLDDDSSCILKYAPTPSDNKDERGKWLNQFIGFEHPLLNYQKSA
ncbi:MAG: toxin-antitoxin system HicB family antitoxin [Planctomycetaceae bacterium]|nr:toxin-antitoxin system HicB family antitoxin [Planctomycetaceae bacterium]